ncbi:MAG: hypothetical protein ACK4SZ_04925 [Allosphingosinicella sp.]|uniref:hypothetical protein n=1 Tax=Allosphingosinicella sp. TaxID=2823234 RepID=UPI00396234C6
MFIVRNRAIRTTVAVAALVGAGLATSASAQPAEALTSTNVAASNSSGGSSRTVKTAQRAGGAASQQVVCVRAQRIASRITQDFCHTTADWERQGGLLPENY